MRLLLLLKRIIRKRPKRRRDEMAVQNIVEGMAKAKALYKKLIFDAHPDRNSENRELAMELTEQINNARFDYRELTKLQNRIKTELQCK